MIDDPQQRGAVMAWFVSPTKSADGIVYVALLPALLVLASIGVTAAMGWDTQALRNTATLSTMPGNADHYVEGLAKLGIVELPGYGRPPALPSYEPPPDAIAISPPRALHGGRQLVSPGGTPPVVL